jgi:hypothetical protein
MIMFIHISPFSYLLRSILAIHLLNQLPAKGKIDFVIGAEFNNQNLFVYFPLLLHILSRNGLNQLD